MGNSIWLKWLRMSKNAFWWPFQGGTSFVDHSCCFCRVFVMLSCASVYCCLVVSCWVHCKGWRLSSRLWCLIVSLLRSHWYPWSGVILDCIDSWSFPSFLLLQSDGKYRHVTIRGPSLLKLCSCSHIAIMALCLFLAVLWVGPRSVIVAFSHSQTQNKSQWLAACGHVSASSQSLRFILSLRMNLITCFLWIDMKIYFGVISYYSERSLV